MSLISIIGRRVMRFSQEIKPQKNIHKYLRTKRAEDAIKSQNSSLQEQQLHSAHYLLYAQFVPVVLVAIPTLYYLGIPTDIYYLQSCNMMQYYVSGLLCFNSFFTEGQENKKKYWLLLATVAAVNSISGPLSLASTVVLGLLNMYFPFTDQKFHRFQTGEQVEKGKTYLGVQGCYYFIVVLLTTFKTYHYLALQEAQNKLIAYERENAAFHKLQQQRDL